MAFLSSYIQKRLLRYALSRVQLFDTDALDLDRLDVGIGRKSNVELRDVALRKTELASLLHLPQNFSIRTASASSLRVTVPADVYSSSISVRVDGVNVSVKLEDNIGSKTSLQKNAKAKSAHEKQSDISSRQETFHDGDELIGQEAVIPSPEDLAKSFLDQEPQPEAAKLEAELASKSINLQQSVSSSETDDDTTGYGTGGNGLLPGFLAGFFAGVADRLEVSVTNVKVTLTLDLDLPDTVSDSSAQVKSQLPVEVVFSIENVDVEGVTTTAQASKISDTSLSEQKKLKIGKRLVSLKGLRTQLVCDHRAFKKLFPQIKKDPKTQSSSTHTWPNNTFEDVASPSLSENTEEPQTPTNNISAHCLPSDDLIALSPSIGESPKQEHGSYASIDPGNMADIETEGSTGSETDLIGGPWNSRWGEDHAQKQGYRGDMQSALQSFRRERGPLMQERLRRRTSSKQNPTASDPTSSAIESDLLGDSTSALHTGLFRGGREASNEINSIVNTPTEDGMPESKFFSHDEAESIYVSAINEGDIQFTGAQSNSNVENPPSPEAHPSPPSPVSNKRAESFLLPSQTSSELSQCLFKTTSARIWLPSLAPKSKNGLSDTESEASHERSKFVTTEDRERHASMPGAFSMYAESAIQARDQVNIGRSSRPMYSTNLGEPHANSHDGITDIEIELDNLSSCITLHALSLALQTMRKLQNVFTSKAPPKDSWRAKKFSQDNSSSRSFNLHLLAHRLNFSLRIGANEFNHQEDYSTSRTGATPLVSEEVDSLFNLRLQDSHFNLEMDKGLAKAEVDISKLMVDIADQQVIRFDQSATLRSSVKDTQILNGKDLSMHFTQEPDSSAFSVSTMPIVIDLDATKLDETLDYIGGFSALFDISNSILSDNTPEASMKVAPPNLDKPRVRFEADPSPKTIPKPSTRLSVKINTRIGGSRAYLRAGRRALNLQSSAVKIVVRGEGVGAQIDDVKISGPVLIGHGGSEPSQVRVRNLGLKFLATPEEQDLTKLISLVTPSKDNFERGDGGVIVETMLRQRKNGTALRLSVSSVTIDVTDVVVIRDVREYVTDLSRLGTITKYLPEETRPGMLLLGRVNEIDVKGKNLPKLGSLDFKARTLELANVSAPSLLALSVTTMSATRNLNNKLLHPLLPQDISGHGAMLMARLVGEDIVPTLEVKLMNTCMEYDVAAWMEMVGVDVAPHGVDTLAASVAINQLEEHKALDLGLPVQSRPASRPSSTTGSSFKLDLGLNDCSIGLTPRGLNSQAQFVLTDVRVQSHQAGDQRMHLELGVRKASLLLINDRGLLAQDSVDHGPTSIQTKQLVPFLCEQGYVTVGWISAAQVRVRSHTVDTSDSNRLDVEFDDELLVLESCADSTQTLSELFSALQPPPPPVQVQKYRTEIATVEDMMASFTGDGFPLDNKPMDTEVVATEFDANDFLLDDSQDANLFDAMQDYSLNGSRNDSNHSSILDLSQEIEINALGLSKEEPNSFEQSEIMERGLSPTVLPENFQSIGAKWDSDRNKYIPVSHSEIVASPFKLHITNMHIIWNLHDGYDWKKTRETISDAVQDIAARTGEKRMRQRQLYEDEDQHEPVIGDFLFNSIYVGVPVNADPREIAKQINKNVDDQISETASHATTMTDATPRPHRLGRSKPRKLKLERSPRHKITFELSGVSADMFIFPPGQETVSSTDVRIHDFEIFDHVPSSTWKKFATYMRDAGPREDKKPMVHLEICNVKPVPDLLASELVLRVTVLPVRLHVDQDALDFMTRFFDFHDGESKESSTPGDQPYLQRVEVLPVPLKLDYKPKKVDYAGLRSGRTKEFMNFFNLDSADMVLKHAIIYGCTSFAKLHGSLEDIWMPDIKRNQLPTVLSGLNGVRTLVNVGSGVRNLVTVPVQEYRKDGRIVRSISKGALSFARTSGSELTKFGARLAVGAQTALQGAEDFLVKPRQSDDTEWETADLGEEAKRAFSRYADQPTGILQGLRGAAKSLERDLVMTRDVVVAVSGEAKDSGSVGGAAKAVARHAPTIVLRPMIGATKAVSQTLMGATNTVDPRNRQRLEDKYKRY